MRFYQSIITAKAVKHYQRQAVTVGISSQYPSPNQIPKAYLRPSNPSSIQKEFPSWTLIRRVNNLVPPQLHSPTSPRPGPRGRSDTLPRRLLEALFRYHVNLIR